VAPLTALASAWFLMCLKEGLAGCFKAGWPREAGWALGALLACVPLFNALEFYGNWPEHEATWRSFSPEATLAARRAAQAPEGWEIYISMLEKEYQFHGFEREQFVGFLLKQQGRGHYPLQLSQAVQGEMAKPEPKGVLAIWADSDADFTQAMRRDFPEIPIEEAKDPHDAKNDYLAASIPWDRIPKGRKAFFFKP
jgi:hypothetical protein